MDPNLLRLYNDELAHLREVGAEFAAEFPKIAARLSMDGVEVTDPYVERLLEGFAFMSARVQLKLNAEYPQLIQHLLETVYPGFLSPVPSMMIARLRPDPLDPNLSRGFTVKRHSLLTSETVRGQNTRCEFRSAHEVTLWPVQIETAQYFTHPPDLPLSQLPSPRADMKAKPSSRRSTYGSVTSTPSIDRRAAIFGNSAANSAPTSRRWASSSL